MAAPMKVKKTTKARQPAARGAASARGGSAGSSARKATRRTNMPVKRTPAVEKRYNKVQQASSVAQALLAKAPDPSVFRAKRAEAARRCDELLAMSFGRHEGRTPVPELRAALADLARVRLSSKAAAWVAEVVATASDHLGAVNTDKSFKPFVLIVKHVVDMSAFS